jgi:hypothetical protein
MLTITASPMFVESRLRHGPGKRVWTRFLDRRRRVDELLLTLIQSRTLRSLRGNAVRHDNVSTARDDVMSLILAGHETTAAQFGLGLPTASSSPLRMRSAHPRDQYRIGGRVPDCDNPRGLAPSLRVPVRDPARRRQSGRDRRFDLHTPHTPVGVYLPTAPRPHHLPGPPQLSSRAVPGSAAALRDVDTLGRRTQALPRTAYGDA